eukprot:1515-Heterococcus_DN1.PRE.1
MQAPNSMLARMSSGDWDHVLPHDTAGRIFLDLDEKWVKPIFQHLFHLSLAHDSNEPLSTPESSFEDSDDLMGYYATLDFFGLTDIFYPDGIEPVQIPLGMIKPQLFIQKVQPVVEGCDWRAHWNMLYKSSRDGYYLESFQKYCKDKPHTVVFVKEQDTGNVYGGYSAHARRYPTIPRMFTRMHAPNKFVFAIKGSTICRVTGSASSCDAERWAFVFGWYDLYCDMTDDRGVKSKIEKLSQEQCQCDASDQARTESITAEEIEVWQIPSMTGDSDTCPIVDPSIADAICVLPTAPAAHNSNSSSGSSVMAFRNDVSSLQAPVTELTEGLQSWLHSELHVLDKQLRDIEHQEQALNRECEFIAYHFPNDDVSTATAAASGTDSSDKASTAQLKGVHNGIVHMILHGDKICTLQQTFTQFGDSKLSHQYGSGRWNTAAAAELNGEGYIVEEYDYSCFRKLINIMRLKALMRSPHCRLSSSMKQKCPSVEPTSKKGALAWMLAHFMITKEDFYSSFATTTSSKKRKR